MNKQALYDLVSTAVDHTQPEETPEKPIPKCGVVVCFSNSDMIKPFKWMLQNDGPFDFPNKSQEFSDGETTFLVAIADNENRAKRISNRLNDAITKFSDLYLNKILDDFESGWLSQYLDIKDMGIDYISAHPEITSLDNLDNVEKKFQTKLRSRGEGRELDQKQKKAHQQAKDYTLDDVEQDMIHFVHNNCYTDHSRSKVEATIKAMVKHIAVQANATLPMILSHHTFYQRSALSSLETQKTERLEQKLEQAQSPQEIESITDQRKKSMVARAKSTDIENSLDREHYTAARLAYEDARAHCVHLLRDQLPDLELCALQGISDDDLAPEFNEVGFKGIDFSGSRMGGGDFEDRLEPRNVHYRLTSQGDSFAEVLSGAMVAYTHCLIEHKRAAALGEALQEFSLRAYKACYFDEFPTMIEKCRLTLSPKSPGPVADPSF